MTAEIIDKKHAAYNEKRKIENMIFDLWPEEIHYCSSSQDVAEAIQRAREKRLKVRVRSGGHHHAGLCSGEQVLVVDVSRMREIEVIHERGKLIRIEIEPGVTVQQMAERWSKERFLFPIGGCDHVHLSGFVLGGGWGRFTRYIGLGCDRLTEVSLVDGQGQLQTLRSSDTTVGDDPLEVIRGGGGCHFGVVTKMVFEISESELSGHRKKVFNFSYTWRLPSSVLCEEESLPLSSEVEVSQDFPALQLIDRYLQSFPKDPDGNFTTACRLMRTRDSGEPELFILVNGWYVAPQEVDDPKSAIQHKMIRSLGVDLWNRRDESQDSEQDIDSPPSFADGLMQPPVFSDPFGSWGPTLSVANPQDPIALFHQPEEENTLLEAAHVLKTVYACGNVHYPHIVDSRVALPQGRAVEEERRGILRLLEHMQATVSPESSTFYVTFHSLGGKVQEGPPSLFRYRDRPYMIQVQAWWEKNNPELRNAAQNWINQSLALCDGWTDGKFVNFAGLDLKQGTRQKLEQYWGESGLRKIQMAKSKFDPENCFDAYDVFRRTEADHEEAKSES